MVKEGVQTRVGMLGWNSGYMTDNLSVPPLPHLFSGNNSTYFIALLGKLSLYLQVLRTMLGIWFNSLIFHILNSIWDFLDKA